MFLGKRLGTFFCGFLLLFGNPQYNPALSAVLERIGMKFEHLIKMFDELSPAPAITRRQLWQGLVLRAEDPCRFDENITEARVLSYENGSLRREVRFGELVVRWPRSYGFVSFHYETGHPTS